MKHSIIFLNNKEKLTLKNMKYDFLLRTTSLYKIAHHSSMIRIKVLECLTESF